VKAIQMGSPPRSGVGWLWILRSVMGWSKMPYLNAICLAMGVITKEREKE